MGSGDRTRDPNANDTGVIWPFRLGDFQADGDKMAVPSDGVLLGVVVALSLTAFIVLLILLVLLVRRCMRKNLKFIDLDIDEDYHITTSRSAPSTRSSSPHASKNRRCSLHKPDKTTLVRSVAMESMPLTTNDIDRSAAVRSILQYQHHLLGHLSPDVNTSIRSSEGESDAEDVVSSGRLTYSVTYNPVVETLNVQVVKVENLRGRGSENAPRDPFVKVYLLPDERVSKQSRVVKGSLNPMFKEDFEFEVAVNEVRTRTLRLSVYEVDKRRMRHALGHVFVPLCDVDLSSSDVVTRKLDNDSQTSAGLGEAFVSLCYNAQTEKLKVIMQRGRDLRKLDFENQKIYMKVQLLYGHRIQKTKKSSAIPASNDPLFNDAFSFNLSCKQLDSSSLRISVMIAGGEKDGDTEYGRITLGSYMNARGEALLHWQEMISNYRQTVTRWHLLSKSRRSNSMESNSSE